MKFLLRICAPGSKWLFIGAFLLGALLICSITRCQEAVAPSDIEQQTDLEAGWGLEVDCNPRYVWRGLALSEGAVAQTSVWMTAENTTYNLWANTNLDAADGRTTNEVDLGLSWERTCKNVCLEPALWIYTYPNQEDAPSTAEAILKLSLLCGDLQIVTCHYLDMMKYPGAYFGDMGLFYQTQVGKHVDLESGFCLGWGSSKFNETYVGPGKFALNVLTFEVCATYSDSKATYIRPDISFTRVLDGDLRSELDDTDILNLGIAFGMEF